MPGTLSDNFNAIITSMYDSKINITTSATTEPVRTKTASDQIDTSTNTTLYIVAGVGGGVSFLIITIVVLGVIASLSVRRMKRSHSVTCTLQSTVKSQQHAVTFDMMEQCHAYNTKLAESPTITSERMFKFKAGNEAHEDKPCLTGPVPTPITTATQDSAEQLYVCPIMSNIM